MSKIFFDTNILVYLFDQRVKAKYLQAQACVSSIADSSSSRAVISTQVLQEFYVVLTSKLDFTPQTTKHILENFADFEIATISTDWIFQAIDLSASCRLSFWDALIVTAAKNSNCDEIWTEDLNHGQVIAGVKIVNPFR